MANPSRRSKIKIPSGKNAKLMRTRRIRPFNRRTSGEGEIGVDLIMVVETTLPNETFTIRCRDTGVGTYAGTIISRSAAPPHNTGATFAAFNDPNMTLTFPEPGQHRIVTDGTIGGLQFDQSADGNKIIEVVSLGDLGYRNMTSAFRGAANIITIGPGVIGPGCTNLNNFARDCSALERLDTRLWNPVDVFTYSGFLWNCGSLIEVPVMGHWDTTSATNMALMMRNTPRLDWDIDRFNVSKVTNMDNIMTGGGFATQEQYDQVLAEWAMQEVQIGLTNVNFGASQYTPASKGEIGREILTDPLGANWGIVDAGPGAVPNRYPDEDFDNVITVPAGQVLQTFIDTWGGPGIKLKVAPGTYDGFRISGSSINGTEEKPFVIEADGEVTLVPFASSYNDTIRIQAASHIHLAGFTIQGVPEIDGSQYQAIHVVSSPGQDLYPRGFTLSDCRINRVTGDGLKFSETYDTVMQNVCFSNNFAVGDPEERHCDFNKFWNATIKDCWFFDHKGLNMKGRGSGTLVEDCVFFMNDRPVEAGGYRGSGYWDQTENLIFGSCVAVTYRNNRFIRTIAGDDIRFIDGHDCVAEGNVNEAGAQCTYAYVDGYVSGNGDYWCRRLLVEGEQLFWDRDLLPPTQQVRMVTMLSVEQSNQRFGFIKDTIGGITPNRTRGGFEVTSMFANADTDFFTFTIAGYNDVYTGNIAVDFGVGSDAILNYLGSGIWGGGNTALAQLLQSNVGNDVSLFFYAVP